MPDFYEKDHLSLVMQKVYKLLIQRSLCDLSICVGNACFHLHKCIVAAACPLLHHLILQSMETLKERSLNLVLHGIKESGFKAVVRYIYSGKTPNDKNSEMWKDFVHTCEYLNLPYPVQRRKKISLFQPKENVHVTLTPNTDGAIDVVLRKELDLASDDNEMDIPIEMKQTENRTDVRNEVIKSNPIEVDDDALDESTEDHKVLCEIKGESQHTCPVRHTQNNGSPFELEEGARIKVPKMPQNNQSKDIVNCCGRFLIETARENAATCGKITYKCTSCGSSYVAVGEIKPTKVNIATQTHCDSIVQEANSSFQDESNIGFEVEISVPNTEADDISLMRPCEEDSSTFPQHHSSSQSDPSDASQQEGIEELLSVPESDNSEDGGERSLRKCTLTSRKEKTQSPMEKKDVKKMANAQNSKFLCQTCNTGFNLYKHLVAHKEKCVRLRKFKCTHCPLGFLRCDLWERHLLQSHNVQM